jgi:hypothetical protein
VPQGARFRPYAASTTSTAPSESSRTSITRSVLSAPSGIVSPARQLGTTVCSAGGSAGVPSASSSLKRTLPFGFSLPRLTVGTAQHRELAVCP